MLTLKDISGLRNISYFRNICTNTNDDECLKKIIKVLIDEKNKLEHIK